MRIIFKQTLKLDTSIYHLPVGAEIINFGPDSNANLCIWYTFNADESKLDTRHLYIHGTGHHVPDGRRHVGTSVMHDGYVWHLFEQVNEVEVPVLTDVTKLMAESMDGQREE